MVTVTKEAGIPDWGGRLVTQLQLVLNGIGVTLGTLTRRACQAGGQHVLRERCGGCDWWREGGAVLPQWVGGSGEG